MDRPLVNKVAIPDGLEEKINRIHSGRWPNIKISAISTNLLYHHLSNDRTTSIRVYKVNNMTHAMLYMFDTFSTDAFGRRIKTKTIQYMDVMGNGNWQSQ